MGAFQKCASILKQMVLGKEDKTREIKGKKEDEQMLSMLHVNEW